MPAAERGDPLTDGALQVADVFLEFSLLSAAAGWGEFGGARRRNFRRCRGTCRAIRHGFLRAVMRRPAALRRSRGRGRFYCFFGFLWLLHLNRGRGCWNLENSALRGTPLRGCGWRRRDVDQARALTMRWTSCQKHGRRCGDDYGRSFQDSVYSNINRSCEPTAAGLQCG